MIKSVSPIVIIYSNFEWCQRCVSKMRVFETAQILMSRFDKLWTEKSASDGALVPEASVLFGVIKRTPTENLLPITRLTNYYRRPYE
jgi:hypothetical protein